MVDVERFAIEEALATLAAAAVLLEGKLPTTGGQVFGVGHRSCRPVVSQCRIVRGRGPRDEGMTLDGEPPEFEEEGARTGIAKDPGIFTLGMQRTPVFGSVPRMRFGGVATVHVAHRAMQHEPI